MDRPLDVEWRDYELYERQRVRKNRNRFIILSLVVLLFFTLCAVPVVQERLPKWKSLHAAREISIELEHLKTMAIQQKKPIRMKFLADGKFQYEIIEKCPAGAALQPATSGDWSNFNGELKVLSLADAHQFSLKLASDEVCFDPVFGLEGVKSSRVIVIAPVNDLANQRLDRASYVILLGESAKISIN